MIKSLAIVTVEKVEEEFINSTNVTFEWISNWFKLNALEKTEDVLLIGRKRIGNVEFCLDGHIIEPKEMV